MRRSASFRSEMLSVIPVTLILVVRPALFAAATPRSGGLVPAAQFHTPYDGLDPKRKGLKRPGRGSAITRKELAARGWSLHDCVGIRLTGES